MKVYCFFCGDRYFCNISNSKIYGPVIETTCPHCKERLVKNFSKYLEEQVVEAKYIGSRFEKINVMINMGSILSSALNEEDRKKKKRKKKK